MNPNLHSFASELLKLAAFAPESSSPGPYDAAPAMAKPTLKGDVQAPPTATTASAPSPLTTPSNMVGNNTFQSRT